MSNSYAPHQEAALSLIVEGVLTEKEGQFCGGLVFRQAALTPKQECWLQILLDRHGMSRLKVVHPYD